MKRKIDLKYWILENYWWLLPTILIAMIFLMTWRDVSPSLYIGVTGTILSLFYFIQKQRLEEHRLFREIFADCNERYKTMSKDLAALRKDTAGSLTDTQCNLLIDYFNLCAEEYLYFRRGYIDPLVWKAWNNGMIDLCRAENIRKFWDSEKATESYYGLEI